MALTFRVEISGLHRMLDRHVRDLTGTDRIVAMRKGISRAANRCKYYMKRELAPHMKSGLLYGAASYRAKYYRNTDTLVAVIGIKSKQSTTYNGRLQVSHKYAHFLIKGRSKARQLLRQPPFARKDPNGKPRFHRTSGKQPPYINLQSIIDANRQAILDSAEAMVKRVVAKLGEQR